MKKSTQHPPATDDTPRSCDACRKSVDIGDPSTVVCSAHLDFRPRHLGGDCGHFERKRAKPLPPQLADPGTGAGAIPHE